MPSPRKKGFQQRKAKDFPRSIEKGGPRTGAVSPGKCSQLMLEQGTESSKREVSKKKDIY